MHPTRIRPTLGVSLFLALGASCATSPGATHDAVVRHTAQAPAQEAPGAADSLHLTAHWSPMEGGLYGLERILAEYEPAIPAKDHPAAAFAPFLPPPETEPNEVYEVDPASFLPFLKQLHPGAKASLRHGLAVEGARGIVVRRTDETDEILLRFHGEFELKPEDTFLLVSQFEGLLEVERETKKPISFRLSLPPRETNADIATRDTENGFFMADIGTIPRMEVLSANATPLTSYRTPERPELDAGRRAMELSLYPSAAIDWRPLDEAIARSRKLEKPLHVVVVFGTLDDESC